MTTTTLTNSFHEWLVVNHACHEACAWVGDKTAYQAWRSCQRGDWMLWLAFKARVDRKLIVLAACDCARTALRYVPVGEDRPRLAIEAAEAWCRGEVDIAAVKSTAYAAADAARASYAADAADAADAAADAAAYAAYDAATVNSAAYAADAAAYAAYDANATVNSAAYAAAAADAASASYASYAAADAAYAANAARASAKCAQLVRRRIPWDAVRDGMEE